MLNKNEKKILNFTTYIPLVLVICLSIVATYLFFLDKNKKHNEDRKILKEKYIQKKKEIIKDEVYRIYDYINYEKNNSEKFLKASIKNRVNEVYQVVDYIYNKYKGIESKEKIIERIKDSIYNYKFNNKRGYFYIYTLNGKNIMHPLKKNLEGKNLINFKDIRGEKVIKKIINSLNDKEGAFNEIFWEKPDRKGIEYKKITYNKVFKPYNLVIGTGEYIKDYEKELKIKILSYINTRKYSKNGYIFITNYEGEFQAHIDKKTMGKNRINYIDKDGVTVVKNIIEIAKKGEGYIKYIATIKPETKLPSRKIAFIKGFDDWNWAIGTGFYTDELNEEISKLERYITYEKRKDIVNLLVISVIVTTLFLFVSLYISNILKNRFIFHRKELLKHVHENRQKDSMLAQQSKMAAMGEMIQNIAHQWRQPLSTISTVASGVKLKKEYGLLTDEDLLNGINIINNSTKYLSQTIEDFRDFFNPNKEVKYFNIRDTLKKALKLLDVQLSSQNVKIDEKFEDVYICGYESELIQVIINLLNNSRDEFTKKNIKEKIIMISVKNETKYVEIFIKDNAGGIKENILQKIFEPYFTTKSKSEGTGIGLYMAKEIIHKNMNGELSVSNDEFLYNNIKYKGALFKIKLYITE